MLKTVESAKIPGLWGCLALRNLALECPFYYPHQYVIGVHGQKALAFRGPFLHPASVRYGGAKDMTLKCP